MYGFNAIHIHTLDRRRFAEMDVTVDVKDNQVTLSVSASGDLAMALQFDQRTANEIARALTDAVRFVRR